MYFFCVFPKGKRFLLKKIILKIYVHYLDEILKKIDKIFIFYFKIINFLKLSQIIYYKMFSIQN